MRGGGGGNSTYPYRRVQASFVTVTLPLVLHLHLYYSCPVANRRFRAANHPSASANQNVTINSQRLSQSQRHNQQSTLQPITTSQSTVNASANHNVTINSQRFSQSQRHNQQSAQKAQRMATILIFHPHKLKQSNGANNWLILNM